MGVFVELHFILLFSQDRFLGGRGIEGSQVKSPRQMMIPPHCGVRLVACSSTLRSGTAPPAMVWAALRGGLHWLPPARSVWCSCIYVLSLVVWLPRLRGRGVRSFAVVRMVSVLARVRVCFVELFVFSLSLLLFLDHFNLPKRSNMVDTLGKKKLTKRAKSGSWGLGVAFFRPVGRIVFLSHIRFF